MPYLNINEVESALSVASSPPNDTFTQLITLPNLTHEGRTCHAIKIANGSGPHRVGVYFLGGIHSREWGSPDILINLIEQLTLAYRTNTGITLGGKSFAASQIQDIVNNLDLFIFPQANPDGRNYSMTIDPMWRKNRRAAPSSNPSCPGVDVNRNYDFLWNYPLYYSSSSPIENSTDPCSDVYIGPAAVSEPETQNVVWLTDNHPNIAFFVDLHSFGEDILFSWGDDNDQSTDPTMNFQNSAYNSVRGIPGDTAYKEYIPNVDHTTAVNLANRMSSAIQAVRGRAYLVEEAVGLYPTAGASDDYHFSRYFVDPSKPRVISYTLEWGAPGVDLPSSFHPPYSEMQNIIQEITAGLLDFCLGVIVPTITWINPPDIVYGTALDSTRLNATASVAGTFTYTPAANTVLNAGPNQPLTVLFTPSDPTYQPVTATVDINVLKATPVLHWANPPDIDHGTALDGTQLNATATWVVGGNPVTVPGTFTYTPPAGTVLPIGSNQALSVLFLPTDLANYGAASATVHINVRTGYPILMSVTFAPVDIQQNDRVGVTVLVKNDSINPHPTQGPDPGFEYSEGDTYQTKGFPSLAGAYRIGVDLEPSPYKVADLYRWGFGHTLAPGEVVAVNGYIRFHNSRENGQYYVAMIEEINNVVQDRQGTTGIVVERP